MHTWNHQKRVCEVKENNVWDGGMGNMMYSCVSNKISSEKQQPERQNENQISLTLQPRCNPGLSIQPPFGQLNLNMILWNDPMSSLTSLSQLLCTSYRILDSVGEGEGGMIWENSIKPCTLSYVKQRSSASSIHEAGHPKLVLWDTLEG